MAQVLTGPPSWKTSQTAHLHGCAHSPNSRFTLAWIFAAWAGGQLALALHPGGASLVTCCRVTVIENGRQAIYLTTGILLCVRPSVLVLCYLAD